MADGAQIYQMLLASQPGFSDWWRRAEESRLARNAQAAATEQRRLTIDEMRRKAEMERARQQAIGEAMRPTASYSVPDLGVTQGPDGQPIFPTRPQVPTGPAGLGDVRRTMTSPDPFSPETIAKVGALFGQMGYDPSDMVSDMTKAATERDWRQSTIENRRAGTDVKREDLATKVRTNWSTDFAAAANAPTTSYEQLFTMVGQLDPATSSNASKTLFEMAKQGVSPQDAAANVAKSLGRSLGEIAPTTGQINLNDQLLTTIKDPITGKQTVTAAYKKGMSEAQRAAVNLAAAKFNKAVQDDSRVMAMKEAAGRITQRVSEGKLNQSILMSRNLKELIALEDAMPGVISNMDGRKFQQQQAVYNNILTKLSPNLMAHTTALKHADTYEAIIRAMQGGGVDAASLSKLKTRLSNEFGVSTDEFLGQDGKIVNEAAARAAAALVHGALAEEATAVFKGRAGGAQKATEHIREASDPYSRGALASLGALRVLMHGRNESIIGNIEDSLQRAGINDPTIKFTGRGGVTVTEQPSATPRATKAPAHTKEVSADEVLGFLRGGK